MRIRTMRRPLSLKKRKKHVPAPDFHDQIIGFVAWEDPFIRTSGSNSYHFQRFLHFVEKPLYLLRKKSFLSISRKRSQQVFFLFLSRANFLEDTLLNYSGGKIRFDGSIQWILTIHPSLSIHLSNGYYPCKIT